MNWVKERRGSETLLELWLKAGKECMETGSSLGVTSGIGGEEEIETQASRKEEGRQEPALHKSRKRKLKEEEEK